MPRIRIKEHTPIKHTNIGIVGLGMIGASIARSLKWASPIYNIIGVDNDKEVLEYAFDTAIINLGHTDYSILRGCEVVFIAVPLQYTAQAIKSVFDAVGKSAIITDTASVKAGITDKLPEGIRFVGGHPMAGSEKSGIKASSKTMFENAHYILIKDNFSTEDDFDSVFALVNQLKAKPLVVDTQTHDRTVAAISHLPHMAAYALVNSALTDEPSRLAAAGGFRDITRIASSNGQFWARVALLNKQRLLSALDVFQEQLNQIKNFIKNDDLQQLSDYFEQAKQKREQIESVNDTYYINIEVPDVPGAAAKITGVLAKKKINISSLVILNSREGQGGALQAGFENKQSFEQAKNVLIAKKFTISF